MKKIYFLFLILPFLAVACSSNDDNNDSGGKVDPSAVFPNGQPQSVAGMSIVYNTDGWVTIIEDGETEVIFTYSDAVKTKETLKYPSDVIMKYDDGYDKYTIYMALGSNGFVSSCVQVDEEYNDEETWSFKYNSNGQLSEMRRSEGENEVTTITYKDGNIVKVSMVSDEEGEYFSGTIAYTSDTHKGGIENKGGIMMFDVTLGIDMDEMQYAYYAGILGKATKQLPLQLTDEEGSETTDFEWTLDDKGRAISLFYMEDERYPTTWEFEW